MSNILVIGDSCKDIFVYCTCNRLAPEFPVQVLDIVRQSENGGMAKNVEANVKSLNANCDIITNENWRDLTKTRYVDEISNYMFVRVDTNHICNRCDVSFDSIQWDTYDAVIISDYDKGFVHTEDIKAICNSHPCVVIDTKKKLGPWIESAKFIKINHQEYNNNKDIIHNNPVLSSKIVRTMGPNGVLHRDIQYPVKRVEVRDVSGAGDSFLAGLVIQYVKTQDIKESINYANTCATTVVQKPGVSVI